MNDRDATKTNVIAAEVSGWNTDDESVTGDGYGATEDEAIDRAIRDAGIVEVGDVRIVWGHQR